MTLQTLSYTDIKHCMAVAQFKGPMLFDSEALNLICKISQATLIKSTSFVAMPCCWDSASAIPIPKSVRPDSKSRQGPSLESGWVVMGLVDWVELICRLKEKG